MSDFMDYLGLDSLTGTDSPTLDSNFANLVSIIDAASDPDHPPKIVFTDYMNPFPPNAGTCPDTFFLKPSQIQFLANELMTLDSDIETAVDGLNDSNVGFVDISNALAGHTWCTKNPYDYGLSLYTWEDFLSSLFPWFPGASVSQAPFHPTANGQKAIANVVVPEVETLLNDTSQVPTFTSESSDDSGSTNGVTAEAGGAVTGTSSGFSPGESVDATLHSTPIDLGSFTADSNGDVSFSVTIPATMPSGQHELILMGDTSGLGVTLPVFVPYPPTGPAFTLDAPPTSLVTGSPYLYSFETSGNPASTYALNAGAPSWLSVDDYGDVFGTPPSGTTSFTYSVTASNGVEPDATSGPFTVTVSPPALTPEAPFAILLPIGGLTVFGVLLARRRKRLNVREEIIPDQPN